jgi:hypothetical protein
MEGVDGCGAGDAGFSEDGGGGVRARDAFAVYHVIVGFGRWDVKGG